MPVTGSAESVMREITRSLENGLRHYLATQMLVSTDSGPAQVSFYLFKLAPNPDDAIRYNKATRYLWIRALFLCGKLKDFMSIDFLTKKHVAMSQDLEAFWWKLNEYLLPEDRAVMKSLADTPTGKDPKQFSETIIGMFKLVKAQYLEKTKKVDTPSTLH